jgi:hypothetical protein
MQGKISDSRLSPDVSRLDSQKDLAPGRVTTLDSEESVPGIGYYKTYLGGGDPARLEVVSICSMRWG